MEFFCGRLLMSSTVLILVSITVLVDSHSHHFRHHRDRFKRQQGAHLYLPGSYVTDNEDPDAGPWEEWSGPSACSRTCGGGVSTQYRRCTPGYTCQGPTKRHFSCNTQDCDDSSDYRSQQCSEFDKIPFEGITYQWFPYDKAPNSCELNCMPRGERFYYRHKLHVEDGTRCNADKLDVCIEGKCYPVGCDMMLGSSAREDKCRICGGDGSNCNTVSGLLDMQNLQMGYNDILLIPAGATNIVVREIAPSNNYLAVRNTSGHYHLNGNWRIDFSRVLRFSGCDFNYNRQPQGFSAPDRITCLGPTDEPLFIVLLQQDKNPGIEYEYSVPQNIVTSTLNETYAWTFDQYTPCTSSCGGGIQYRNVSCAGRRSLEPVDPGLCDPTTKPAESQRCGEQPCAARWVTKPWEKCSAPCGVGGTQTRQILCEQVIANGVASIVDEDHCSTIVKPAAEQACNQGEICAEWHIGRWKPCDHLCGDGKRTRKVTCYRKLDGKIKKLDESQCAEEKPETEKSCNLRPCEGVDWVTSDWSGCDKCGLNSETRRVQCATAKGEVHPESLCDAEDKPETERECKTDPKGCDFEWYASQWSQCSAKCGKGVKTRKVFCASIDDLQKVEESNCDVSKKYEAIEECEAEEETCPGEWFSGPWSKCSKECGGGDMTRKVICMRDNETVPATECGPDSIPSGSEACNTQACDEDEVLPVEATKPVDVTDETEPSKEYSETIDIVTTPSISETTEIDEDDYEIVESEECEDGEWIEENDGPPIIDVRNQISDMAEDRTKSADESTQTSLALDDLMLGDESATGEEKQKWDWSHSIETGSGEGVTTASEPFTDEGSGDTESTTDSSNQSTDATDVTDLTESTQSSDMTESTQASESTQSSDVTDETGETGVTSNTPAASEKTETNYPEVLPEAEIIPVTTAPPPQTSDSTDNGSTQTDDGSTTSSDMDETATTDGSSTDATASTDDSSTESTIEVSTDSTITAETESTEITESTIEVSTDSTVTEETESTGTTESTIEVSTDSTVTEETESTVMTESTIEVSTDSTVTEETKSTDTTESTIEVSTDSTVTEETESTVMTESTIEVSTDSTVTEETKSTDATESTIKVSTDSTVTEETESTVMTESTIEVSTDSTVTESTDMTESTIEVSTDSTVTESTEMTESTIEVSTDSTVTESTEMTESTMEVSTDSTVTEETESTDTTESTIEVSTDSTITEETESTFSTEFDIWSSTTESSTIYGKSDITDIFKPKLRKCKRRKQKTCKTTEFGCCYDQITPAEGPFGKGCPTPKTCKESKFGCCEDGVSQALGKNFKGCPSTHCDETLFGCCSDRKTPAEGENEEGCPPPPPACLKSKFGCCPDNVTEAKQAGDKCEPGETKEGGKEEDCTNTTFGCCPDGKTPAAGEDSKGCDTAKCAETTYGCCPDDLTAAEGPNYRGCNVACGDTMFGCCEDGSTPAHGYNREGCCLSSTHGCCPDNTKPADGPNNEGCGCEYSPYRCCPDNVTAAQGHNNEGCGCQYSEHGCCPDNHTLATGPEYEGCLCHTFQFGCCPDGFTVVKGPQKQGCTCRESEFGCCADEQTAATGPDGQGCTCAESKFGCCIDGDSEAQGEDFEGCEEIPVNLQAGCFEPKQRGDCRNFTVKWFFDMEYGSCSRFWYGGCDGNNNRYKTQEECKEVCIEPTGKKRCNLPKVTGPCEGYYPSWHYDKDKNHCAQFIYGGCLGNNNRFETAEECTKECVVDSRVDSCDLPVEQGPCRGQFVRWYFDEESSRCQQFYFGGCQGNGNNFATEMACKEKCSPANRKKDVCEMPKVEGNCTAREAKWYYDAAQSSCKPFYYTGCEGNNNNFFSVEECEASCPPEIKKNTCQLAAETGECANYVQRWYYDTKERGCRQFYYGGCGGNGNNFVNEQDCLQSCEARPSPPPEQPQPERPQSPEPQTEFITDYCFQPSDSGPCRNTTEVRWFYDRDGVCKEFLYGGCDGNQNNFMTSEECQNKCGKAQDLCTLPKVVGPCTSFYEQYYYDYNTKTCELFMYGGCMGNENRFDDREFCELTCWQGATTEPYATQQPPPEPEEEDDVAVCFYNVDVGNCNDTYDYFYYDAHNQECAPFDYTGCGGNDNRFASIEGCERKCGRFRGQDVCRFPQDEGPCKAHFSKYYYNSESRLCEEFVYGGCGGNGNRFSSIEECKSMCEHEERKPNVTNAEVCHSPVDVGACGEHGSHKRWYFDNERGECIAFIYTGCGGNYNRFNSFQACLDTCREFKSYPSEPEEPPQPPPYQPEEPAGTTEVVEHPCDRYSEECQELRCSYGLRAYVDESLCSRCTCYSPCDGYHCDYDHECAVEVNYNRTTEQDDMFIAVCRKEDKPGICPTVSSDHTDCPRECQSDVDCAFDLKCCTVGCGMSCLAPQMPAEMITTSYQPAYTEPPVTSGYYPPHLDHEVYEPEVTTREGDVASLKCAIRGNPNPKVSWRKGNLIIDGQRARYRILLDGTLQVITVHKSDSGIYLCVADNGIGRPLQNEVRLNVTDGVKFPVRVLDVPEEETNVIVSLGSPISLNCYALGFPYPTVNWWREDHMVPLKTSQYEQRKDYSLYINRVELSNLGVYTCQAYNGIGKAASWVVTIQTQGPVESSDPNDEKFLKYVIDYRGRPEVTQRPQHPFRPLYRISPSPVYTRPSPSPQYYTRPPDRYPSAQLAKPYTVPVKANITLPETTFGVGTDISIPCDVEGYPIPQVQWFKDNVPIQRSERISITESNRLYIRKTEEADSGHYKCEAYNQYSRSESLIGITIKGVYIDPNCTDNQFFANCALIVKARYCRHNYYARFCCRSCTEAGLLQSDMQSNLV